MADNQPTSTTNIDETNIDEASETETHNPLEAIQNLKIVVDKGVRNVATKPKKKVSKTAPFSLQLAYHQIRKQLLQAVKDFDELDTTLTFAADWELESHCIHVDLRWEYPKGIGHCSCREPKCHAKSYIIRHTVLQIRNASDLKLYRLTVDNEYLAAKVVYEPTF